MKNERLTQHSQPIIQGHHNDISIAGQNAAVNHIPCSFHVGPTMDVHHHRSQPILIMDVCKRKKQKASGHTINILFLWDDWTTFFFQLIVTVFLSKRTSVEHIGFTLWQENPIGRSQMRRSDKYFKLNCFFIPLPSCIFIETNPTSARFTSRCGSCTGKSVIAADELVICGVLLFWLKPLISTRVGGWL